MLYVYSGLSLGTRSSLFFVALASLALLCLPSAAQAADSIDDSQVEQPPLAPCQCGDTRQVLIAHSSTGTTTPSSLGHTYQATSDGKGCYTLSCRGYDPYLNFGILAAQGDPGSVELQNEIPKGFLPYSFLSSAENVVASQCTVLSKKSPFLVADCQPRNGMSSELTTAVYNALMNRQPLPPGARSSCSPVASADGKVLYYGDTIVYTWTPAECAGFLSTLKHPHTASSPSAPLADK